MAAYVPNLTMKNEVVVNTGHPGYSGLVRFRAMFYQPNAAVRKFKVTGLPVPGRTGAWSLFYIDGQPVDEMWKTLRNRRVGPGPPHHRHLASRKPNQDDRC